MWPAGRSTRSWPGTRGSTLGKLGAMADRFGRSFYGEMTDDQPRRSHGPARGPLGPRSGPEGRARSWRTSRRCSRRRAIPRGRSRRRDRRRPGRRGDRGSPRPRRPPPRRRGARRPVAGCRRGRVRDVLRRRPGRRRLRSRAFGVPADAGAAREPRRCGGAAAGRAAARPAVPHELRGDERQALRPGARRDGRGRGLGRVRRRHAPRVRRGVQRRRLARPARLPRPGAPPAPVEDVDEAERRFADVRGNPMAKAALLDAFVDAELRADGTSLAAWLGGVRDRVACGVSIGIAPSLEALLEQVEGTWPRVTGGSS